LGFFQVFYAIFRDFLGFWDLVRFWDFSKDFLGFLMKCTKIFRVIYPSIIGTTYTLADLSRYRNGKSENMNEEGNSYRSRPFTNSIHGKI
jgi:hypothetical protein